MQLERHNETLSSDGFLVGFYKSWHCTKASVVNGLLHALKLGNIYYKVNSKTLSVSYVKQSHAHL